MLTVTAEASPGVSLRDEMIPEMIALAKRIGCRVEIKANGVEFWAHPDDTVADLQYAYDRLYSTSSIVARNLRTPVPRVA